MKGWEREMTKNRKKLSALIKIGRSRWFVTAKSLMQDSPNENLH
jgi:hypothetical protein